VRKKLLAIMVVLALSILITGCGSKTVAVVNGEKIDQADLDKRMKKVKLYYEQQKVSQDMLKTMERQTLDGMIEQLLVLQAAKKEGVYPSQSEIKQAIDEIKSQFGGEEAFKKALEQYSYTIEDLEELRAQDLTQTRLFEKVTAGVKVTDADIKKQYDNNKARYKERAKIRTRAIFIRFDAPDRKTLTDKSAPKVKRNEQEAGKIAEDLIKQLNNGADFVKLAKEKSEDEKSKNDGGLIKDWEGKSPYEKGAVMPPEFDDAAVKLKPGSYSRTPVKTNSGYFIIKLESLTPEKQLSFDEAKEKIKQELLAMRKKEKFDEYLKKFRNDSKIENKLAKDAPAMPSTEMPQAGSGGMGSVKPGTSNPHGPGGSIPLNK